MIKIYKMTLLDFEEIKDNLQIDFDDFWTPSILKSELESENSKYIVAKDDEQIVGFAGIWISPIDVEITNIVTKKDKRGNIIGDEFNIDPHTFSAIWYALDGYEVTDLKQFNRTKYGI